MTFKQIRELTGDNKHKKISQVEFSKMYNIPLATIKQWECGKCKPPDYVLELLLFKVKKDFGYM